MRICVISSTVIPCPPKGYSGLEMLAHQQAVGLANKGHQVLLIAPSESVVPSNVQLHGTTLFEPEKQAYSGYWQKLLDYDVLLDNSWEKWSYILKIEGKLTAPILGVIHAPATTMYQLPPPIAKPCFVAISEDQAKDAREIWKINVEVAYNGVDEDFYQPINIQRNNRYLFLARMSRIKGPHIAIEMAEKFGFELDLVGDDKLTNEPEYVQMLKSRVNEKIVYLGGVDRIETVKYYSSRRCMLHMNKEYREPFGLAPVEAQLCGQPVIAYDLGAMRETIKHAVTGFLVQNEDQLEDLLKYNAVSTIKSDDCREWAKQFSVRRMIDRYEQLCEKAINGGW
jgi:glycosyltransferase involved in cell wall biosynthesis